MRTLDETPFGTITGDARRFVLASCRFCDWTKETKPHAGKRWGLVSRARMGLQLHAIAGHKEHPDVQPYLR